MSPATLEAVDTVSPADKRVAPPSLAAPIVTDDSIESVRPIAAVPASPRPSATFDAADAPAVDVAAPLVTLEVAATPLDRAAVRPAVAATVVLVLAAPVAARPPATDAVRAAAIDPVVPAVVEDVDAAVVAPVAARLPATDAVRAAAIVVAVVEDVDADVVAPVAARLPATDAVRAAAIVAVLVDPDTVVPTVELVAPIAAPKDTVLAAAIVPPPTTMPFVAVELLVSDAKKNFFSEDGKSSLFFFALRVNSVFIDR